MEYKKIISLTRKLAEEFDTSLTPTKLYHSIRNKSILIPYIEMKLPGKNFVLFLFAIHNSNLSDAELNELLTTIDEKLTWVSIVHIRNTDSEIECGDCYGNNNVTCETCDGSGEEECSYCEGSGVDSEDESCDYCDGTGKVDCGDCGGTGESECISCDGSGVMKLDEVDAEYYDFLTYSDSILDSITESSENGYDTPKDVLDSDIIDDIVNDEETLVYDNESEFTHQYKEYNEGDVVFRNWHGDPKIEIRSHLRIYVKRP